MERLKEYHNILKLPHLRDWR